MPDGGARRATAVEAAREVFWSRGYEEASIAEIVEASGLNRYALYSEFGGKRELFLACLGDFVQERRQRYGPAIMDLTKAPMERVRAAFALLIDDMIADRRGCLISQTAVEVAREDPAIGETVQGYFRQLIEHLSAPLVEESAEGRLNPNLTPQMGGQLLFNLKITISVLARAGAPRALLDQTLETTLTALQAPQSKQQQTIA